MQRRSLGPVLVLQERRLRRAAVTLLESQGGISVKGLACAVSLSPDHLERLFKRETGHQLHEAIAEAKLQKAVQLLISSELAIKQIAFASGYAHVSSFVRAFERRFGASPNRYRLKITS